MQTIKFKIIYWNKITQIKNLISQEDYNNIIKPLINQIGDLEIEISKSGKNKKKELEKELKILNSKLKSFGEFFTTNSPLAKAMINNELKLRNKIYNVKFEKLC